MNDTQAVGRSCQVMIFTIVTVLLLGGFWYLRNRNGGWSRSELVAYETELTRPFQRSNAHDSTRVELDYPPRAPKRQGKMLLIVTSWSNVNGNFPEILPEQYLLPPALQATPGDVQTVVLCDRKSVIVGRYTNGAVASMDKLTARFFAVPSGEYLGGADYMGQAPPDKIMVWEGQGKRPLDFLEGLSKVPGG